MPMAPGYLFWPQPTSRIFGVDADADCDEGFAGSAGAILDGMDCRSLVLLKKKLSE